MKLELSQTVAKFNTLIGKMDNFACKNWKPDSDIHYYTQWDLKRIVSIPFVCTVDQFLLSVTRKIRCHGHHPEVFPIRFKNVGYCFNFYVEIAW